MIIMHLTNVHFNALRITNFECIECILNKLKKKKKNAAQRQEKENVRVTSHETNAIHVILSYVNTNRE